MLLLPGNGLISALAATIEILPERMNGLAAGWQFLDGERNIYIGSMLADPNTATVMGVFANLKSWTDNARRPFQFFQGRHQVPRISRRYFLVRRG